MKVDLLSPPQLKVAVIGAAGRMGQWFTNYFVRKGADVTVFDTRGQEALKLSESFSVVFTPNLRDAVVGKNLVLVAVPIDVMPQVLRAIAPDLQENTVLMEIASLKSGVINVLREIAHRKITTISIHPLIGPGATGLSQRRITFTPVVDRESEGRIVAETFPEALVEEVGAEEHDRVMAVVLSLTHFTNLVFSSIVASEDFTLLRKLAGTSFSAQFALAEGILCESPDMLASIQLENPYYEKYVQNFISNAGEFFQIIKEKRKHKLLQVIKDIQEGLSKDPGYASAYGYLYRMINALTLEK